MVIAYIRRKNKGMIKECRTLRRDDLMVNEVWVYFLSFKLSLKPRTNEWNGTKNHSMMVVGGSISGGK
jgi:hypothetical protein